MLVILEKGSATLASSGRLAEGFRLPPFAAEDAIRQARRYKSRRDLTRALKLIARADSWLGPPSAFHKVLENLVMQLCEEPKVMPTERQQELSI